MCVLRISENSVTSFCGFSMPISELVRQNFTINEKNPWILTIIENYYLSKFQRNTRSYIKSTLSTVWTLNPTSKKNIVELGNSASTYYMALSTNRWATLIATVEKQLFRFIARNWISGHVFCWKRFLCAHPKIQSHSLKYLRLVHPATEWSCRCCLLSGYLHQLEWWSNQRTEVRSQTCPKDQYPTQSQ